MTILTAQYYQWLQMELIHCREEYVILNCNKFKADAVRIANFCRNIGYRAEVQTLFGLVFWVKVILK